MQPLVFDRRVPALAGIRSTMAWMRSSTGNPKENSTLPCGRPRRTGAWPRRSRSGPAPAASRGHPAAAGRALAAAPAPSSAPSRGQWRCYCPRCRPAAGRPAPPRPRPPAGPKRPAAGGIRMSSSRWPPRSVPVLWAMLIVASKSIRRRGVPGRERGGLGSPVELPGSGNLVVWAVPGRQALAEDVGGGARCGQAAPGGPPRHLAPVARNTEATPIHSKPRLASRLSLGIARSSNRESASPMGARQRGRKPRSCSSCLGSLAASLPRSSARQLARR